MVRDLPIRIDFIAAEPLVRGMLNSEHLLDRLHLSRLAKGEVALSSIETQVKGKDHVRKPDLGHMRVVLKTKERLHRGAVRKIQQFSRVQNLHFAVRGIDGFDFSNGALVGEIYHVLRGWINTSVYNRTDCKLKLVCSFLREVSVATADCGVSRPTQLKPVAWVDGHAYTWKVVASADEAR